jgi:hypothetical protein
MTQQLARRRIPKRLIVDVLVIVVSLVIIGFGIGVHTAPLH